MFFTKLPQSCHKVCPSEERGISARNSMQFYFVQSCHKVCPSEERGISASNSMQFCFTQSYHKVCPSEERGISTSNSIQFYFVQSCHTVCPSEERGISASNSMQFCYPLAEMKNYCWRKLSWRFLLRRKDKQCEERRIFEVCYMERKERLHRKPKPNSVKILYSDTFFIH